MSKDEIDKIDNVIRLTYIVQKQAEEMQQKIDDYEEALQDIARWNEKDQEDPEVVLLQWRGCVAIARLVLEKHKGWK